VTKLLQRLRDEMVRRDYTPQRPSAATSRSLTRFARTRVRASIGSRQRSSDATTCFSSKSDG
jgi:hypothetical protein